MIASAMAPQACLQHQMAGTGGQNSSSFATFGLLARSSSLHRPTLSLAYSVKERRLNQNIFCVSDYCVEPWKMTPDGIMPRTVKIVAVAARVTEHLVRKVPGVKAMAFAAGDRLTEALKSTGASSHRSTIWPVSFAATSTCKQSAHLSAEPTLSQAESNLTGKSTTSCAAGSLDDRKSSGEASVAGI